MKYLLLLLTLLLNGCTSYMSYEEVQQRVAYCKLNGLVPIYSAHLWNGEKKTYDVKCADASSNIFDSKRIDATGKEVK